MSLNESNLMGIHVGVIMVISKLFDGSAISDIRVFPATGDIKDRLSN